LLAGIAHFFGGRGGGFRPSCQQRAPLKDRRKKVSSASTMPLNVSDCTTSARKKRCRQRALAVLATEQRLAASRTVVRPARQPAKRSQEAFWRSRAKGVPVRALKVRAQAWQR
jgi:hypothetical protein